MHLDRVLGIPTFRSSLITLSNIFFRLSSALACQKVVREDTKLALDVGFDVISCSCCSRCSSCCCWCGCCFLLFFFLLVEEEEVVVLLLLLLLLVVVFKAYQFQTTPSHDIKQWRATFEEHSLSWFDFLNQEFLITETFMRFPLILVLSQGSL